MSRHAAPRPADPQPAAPLAPARAARDLDRIIAALARQLGDDHAARIAAGWHAGWLPALRLNPLRGDPAATRAALAADGIHALPHRLSPWSCTIDAAGEYRLRGKHPLLVAGALYLQHLASQLPPLLPPDGIAGGVLDLCAAPGGKTTLLAVRYGAARVVACERAPIRMEKLKRTLERQGCASVRVVAGDGRRPPPAVGGGRYGVVLVDAPCSGSGVIVPARPATWEHLAPDPDGYVLAKARQQAEQIGRAHV